MSRLEALERDVRSLTPLELEAFRSWFITFDHDAWDRQIASDSTNGKLDLLANQA